MSEAYMRFGSSLTGSSSMMKFALGYDRKILQQQLVGVSTTGIESLAITDLYNLSQGGNRLFISL